MMIKQTRFIVLMVVASVLFGGVGAVSAQSASFEFGWWDYYANNSVVAEQMAAEGASTVVCYDTLTTR